MRLSSLISWSSFLARLYPSSRAASTMTIEPAKLNVLQTPLQPLTQPGDSTHPTGFFRDGYCWGSEQDPGKHYIGGIVTSEFLQFSKERGNDLTRPGGSFPGLQEGCRWCLCVNRWKEALLASREMGDRIVPRVDLNSTALSALQSVKLEDLQRFDVSKQD